MAGRADMEPIIPGITTDGLIWKTVNTSTRNVRNKMSTGTATRDFIFRKIRSRRIESFTPLNRLSGLSIWSIMMISVKRNMSETGRPDIQTETGRLKISGGIKRPVRRNR